MKPYGLLSIVWQSPCPDGCKPKSHSNPAPASTPTPSATPSPKFAAPTQELNPGYPWQYNLLQFQDNQLTVYTRRREEKNGAWKPDARWGQGAGKSSLDRYEIQL